MASRANQEVYYFLVTCLYLFMAKVISHPFDLFNLSNPFCSLTCHFYHPSFQSFILVIVIFVNVVA